MPKMTHPMDRGHVVDVADEKVAVYLGQGWSVKSDQAPGDGPTAVTRQSLAVNNPPAERAADSVKKATAKRTAKKAAPKPDDEA
jgi:hypothetical protein